jgi:hypothetical protein
MWVLQVVPSRRKATMEKIVFLCLMMGTILIFAETWPAMRRRR